MGLDTNCRFQTGKLNKGKLNLITDVKGIKVGHKTLSKDNVINTGVTAITFSDRNIFEDKVVAASEVLNGYGKSIGLVQINELGTIETPILLTNTLAVGTCSTALVKYMIANNPTLTSVNPVVGECNDASLNDIRGLYVNEQDALDAINSASETFLEGDVGAGKGMSCLGYKGGIGSSSRVITIDDKEYTLGALVLSNFGSFGNLRIDGEKIGEKIVDKENDCTTDKGSIMMIIACDIPLSARQMKRVCKRAAIGLANTGSFMGNGSGDVVIGFSTYNHIKDDDVLDIKCLNDNKLDIVFTACAEAIEESIISSLLHANSVTGYKKTRTSLTDYLDKYGI